MVTINQQIVTITKGDIVPIMYVHNLTVKKNVADFVEGSTLQCFVAKYDGGRFAVWESTYTRRSIYHVFDSERELHDHFDEL